ncbi:PQQ-like beta-propeller repeat protein [Flavimaricola marinus]|uniref:Outer membrane protein assembly factor BamB n=1 Tax=Flavimaricola marinus TaxID=1819565 RepID=A0A238LHH9_9RHOB|nr:PQQ-like beta-propeller repeat protein [Flavimaricola marinus]SMY09088.1 Outer membrane protein assembly factor BamB precursor [Flavimaricola marinus]
MAVAHSTFLRSKAGLALLALSFVAACAEPDVILPGERLDLRDGMPGAEAPFVNAARPIALPAARTNANFTHRAGSATHQLTHPALGASLTLAFSAPIGEGNTRRNRITADPVVLDGRVFTMDALGVVSAFTTGGQPLWSRSLIPPTDRAGEASGGGLAAAGETVYATTGFGRLVAMDVATGGERWVQDLDASGGAPTVAGDLVYVVARDSRAWAIERSSGRVAWTLDGTPSTANFAGGAGPAVNNDVAIFPFPSGEVLGAFPQGGLRRWSSVIAGARPGEAGSLSANDISSDPVILGDTVYVGNLSGRVVAMQATTGERLWTATEGALSPVVPVGGSLFLVNDINELVRLDASDGTPIWRQPLPQSEESGGLTRRTSRFVHFGPILAGGRLVVASSDGVLRSFDPVSGALVSAVPLPGGAASHPVVAGGVLYVVSADGQLMAFR